MPAVFNEVGDMANPKFIEIVVKSRDTTSNGDIAKFFQVYNFRADAAPGGDGPFALMGHIRDEFSAVIADIMPTTFTFYEVAGRYMDDPTSPVVTVDMDEVPGTMSTDRSPNFNAVKMGLRTSARGKNFMGSKHFGPVMESFTTKDNLNADGVTAWTTVKDFIGGFCPYSDGPITYRLIVLSRNLSNLTLMPSIFTYAQVSTVTLNQRIGRMIRRQEKSSS